jgi:hypothetical protein
MSEMKKVYEKLEDLKKERDRKIYEINKEYEPLINEINKAIKTMEKITGLSICDDCGGNGYNVKMDAVGDTERNNCGCNNGFIGLYFKNKLKEENI